jgi:hypothetical protein
MLRTCRDHSWIAEVLQRVPKLQLGLSSIYYRGENDEPPSKKRFLGPWPYSSQYLWVYSYIMSQVVKLWWLCTPYNHGHMPITFNLLILICLIYIPLNCEMSLSTTTFYIHYWLVVSNIFYLPNIGLGIIIPTDFHIFQWG